MGQTAHTGGLYQDSFSRRLGSSIASYKWDKPASVSFSLWKNFYSCNYVLLLNLIESVCLPIHSLRLCDTYSHPWPRSLLMQVMACRPFGPNHYQSNAKLLSIGLAEKIQRHSNRNSISFIHENAFENIGSKMAAILYRPQCVNTLDR